MTTLSDIEQRVYYKLGQVDAFIATGGSATTIINTNFANETDPPDEERFKNNYVYVHRDTAGAAPEGRRALVSAYNPATFTITHATVTDAIAVGDEIWLAKQSSFPLAEVVAAINHGLGKLGSYIFRDESLTTIENTSEYDIPAGVKELLAVEIGDSTDGYQLVDSEIVAPTIAMTGTKLSIPKWSAGKTIRIYAHFTHPLLTDYSSTLYPFISEELASAATLVSLLEGYINSKSGSAKPHWSNVYAEAIRQVNEGRVLLPTIRIKKKLRGGLKWPAIVSD